MTPRFAPARRPANDVDSTDSAAGRRLAARHSRPPHPRYRSSCFVPASASACVAAASARRRPAGRVYRGAAALERIVAIVPVSCSLPPCSTTMRSADLRDHRAGRATHRRPSCEARAHTLERPQHLDLRGHVERGGRLVEDHQLRLGDQRHGRHQPLQLSARDLVRITATDRPPGSGSDSARNSIDAPCLRPRRATSARGSARDLDHLAP